MNAYTIPIAVLNLPKSDEKLVTYATGVLTGFTGNAHLSNPPVSVAVFAGYVATYATATAAAPNGGKQAKADRLAARGPVVETLKEWRNYAQSVARTQPTAEDAIALILSGKLQIKKIGTRVKPELSARNSGIPGTVLLLAHALRKQATYYFQYSLDQTSWSSAPDALKASATLTGLATMRVYYFRFRRLTRAGMSDWSQIVSLTVV